MKIVYATVYRPAYGDCSNFGISSMNTTVRVFDDCTPSEAIADCRKKGWPLESALIADHSPSCGREYLKLVPLQKKRDGLIGPMAGGNFAYSWDKDFPAYSFMGDTRLPIPIHDRYETQEEYDALSR